MEKIMKLAALMREAKELVEEINKEGIYDIISAAVEIKSGDAFADEKQAEIHFFKLLPDFEITPMRNLYGDSIDKVTFRESVEVDGVECFRLVDEKEVQDNAKVAV